MQIAVLVACCNRRDKTLECIRRLRVAAKCAKVEYRLILFDDGSSDGTGGAVLKMEPHAVVLKGDGNYYWNRSMYEAFGYALEKGFDGYLWLNDDTMLEPEALQVLQSTLACMPENEAIVVGAIKDPVSGQISYGGGRRIAPFLKPFRYIMVEPTGQVESVDVINGNVVWIPDGVARRVGNLDPRFEHGMGDTDYSMRARKLDIRIVQTPSFIGNCPRNSNVGSYKDRQVSLKKRLQLIFAPKGLPWRSWLHICVRHGGILWPIHFCWPYVKLLMNRS